MNHRSCQVKDNVISGNGENYQRAAKVMSAVEKHIAAVPNSIDRFLKVLGAHEISRTLADKISEDITSGGGGE